MSDAAASSSSRDARPIPDPTILTTEQLHREIAALRDFVVTEIRHVGELNAERFREVETRFQALAERTAEQKEDNWQAWHRQREDGKEALEAAFQAAKDAVALQTEASDKAIAKSEAATTKQIDALGMTVEKSSQAKDEKIDDLKARLDRLEGRSVGTQLSVGLMVTVLGLLFAGVTAVVIVTNAVTGG